MSVPRGHKFEAKQRAMRVACARSETDIFASFEIVDDNSRDYCLRGKKNEMRASDV